MTALGHFRLSPEAIGWGISPQFGRLPLRAWVKPLRPRVKVTQARNGMCLKYAGRAQLSHEPRFGEPFQSKLPETPVGRLSLAGLRPATLASGLLADAPAARGPRHPVSHTIAIGGSSAAWPRSGR